jgi:hypothetical protein
MIFSYPFYSVVLTNVPRHVSGYFYYLEFSVAAAGSRAKFLDYLDQIGVVSGYFTIIPTGICNTGQLLVLLTSKITETESAVAVVDYYISNTSL